MQLAGISDQGYECVDCRFPVHRDCKKSAHANCSLMSSDVVMHKINNKPILSFGSNGECPESHARALNSRVVLLWCRGLSIRRPCCFDRYH